MSEPRYSNIYTILSDSLKMIKKASHPLSKLARGLLHARGINKFAWDRLIREYINTNPTTKAKDPTTVDLTQERARLNKYIADPDRMTYSTFIKLVQVLKASKIHFSVTLVWEDEKGEVIDTASANVVHIVTTK